MSLVYDIYQAPFGQIFLVADDIGIKRVVMTADHWEESYEALGKPDRNPQRCGEATAQLREYFAGHRQVFTVPLSMAGPVFSQKVWRELISIPFGETRTYGEIAWAIGHPQSCRAVGQANRNNPLPLFIPCHRVIGKDGSLTGYIGKGYLNIKEYLLEMERTYRPHFAIG